MHYFCWFFWFLPAIIVVGVVSGGVRLIDVRITEARITEAQITDFLLYMYNIHKV